MATKNNSGALFRNKTKTPENKQPDYKGDINIDGVEYWLSAWLKQGKAGTFMSLAVKPKQQGPRAQQAAEAEQANDTPF